MALGLWCDGDVSATRAADQTQPAGFSLATSPPESMPLRTNDRLEVREYLSSETKTACIAITEECKKKGCHARHIAGNDPYDAGCMWTMFARTVFRFSHMNSKQPEATRTVTDIEASHSNAGLREGRHLDGPPSPDIHFVRIATTFLIFWLINCMFLDSRYPQSAKKIRKHLHPL